MTVQELIDRLMLIGDKTMPVIVKSWHTTDPVESVICENISIDPREKFVVALIEVG